MKDAILFLQQELSKIVKKYMEVFAYLNASKNLLA
jgi:hypothetical protein